MPDVILRRVPLPDEVELLSLLGRLAGRVAEETAPTTESETVPPAGTVNTKLFWIAPLVTLSAFAVTGRSLSSVAWNPLPSGSTMPTP